MTNPITKQLEELIQDASFEILEQIAEDGIDWNTMVFICEKEIGKVVKQSQLDLLKTIESEVEELDVYWTRDACVKKDQVLQLLRDKIKGG